MSKSPPITNWQRLRAVGLGPGLRAQLLRGGIGSIGLKLTHTALTILVTAVLARALGADGYGVYAFIYAITNLLALPVTLGVPQLVIRETAKTNSQACWGLMRGLWRWSTVITLVFALVLAAGVLLVLWFMNDKVSDARVNTMLVGIIMVPLIAMARLNEGALRGLGRVVLGQLADNVIRPGLFLLLIIGALFGVGFTLDGASAMALHATAAGVAFVFVAVVLQMHRPNGLRSKPTPIYNSQGWLNAMMPLALIAGAQIVNGNTDVLMLGLLRSDSEVGIYRVATQGAVLVTFGMLAVNRVVQPQFARLYIQREHARLQKLVTQSARAILALAVPVVLLYVFFGKIVLASIFGEEYGAGYTALAILASGQLINATTGCVAGLLNMTGYERDTLRGLVVAACANVSINFALIPKFGKDGAALATAISVVIWNLLLWHAAWKRVGINCVGFPLTRRKKL